MAHALVVDDSRTVRKLLAQTLVNMGFEVSEADNGRTALASLEARNEPPQLILTDWNMPEMNGLEFLRAVRRESCYKGVPVVMVTTETEISQMTTALEAGANEYVMKPFTPDILADKLRIAGVRI